MRDDEGCQGNPPCQPASAYFSPLSRSIQHPPASSRTKRTPSLFPPRRSRPSRPAPRARPHHPSAGASHGTFLRSFFSLRASPCAHYRRPSQTNPLAFLPHPRPLSPSPSVISRFFPSLRLSSDVSRSLLPFHPLLIFPDEFVLKISFYIVLLYLIRCFGFCSLLFMNCLVNVYLDFPALI